jgi:hypothetical protein
MDEEGIPGLGTYSVPGFGGDLGPMREAAMPASSPSQVPGTSGSPSCTPSATPGGVASGNPGWVVGLLVTPVLAVISIVSIVVGVAGQSFAQDAATLQRMDRQVLGPMLGTLSVEAQPYFVEGRLNGCTIVFNALAQDWAYKQGGYISIAGSFGLLGRDEKLLAVSLKVVLHDLDPRTMTFTPSPPATAYLVSGNTTTKSEVVLSETSDTPGALFTILKAERTLKVLAEGLSRNKVTIAFTRTLGGTDIQLPIDTSVVETSPTGQRTRSLKALTEFSDCTELACTRFG